MTPSQILPPEAIEKLEAAGYVVVPREPTDAMLDAAFNVPVSIRGVDTHVGHSASAPLYKAMITTATKE